MNTTKFLFTALLLATGCSKNAPADTAAPAATNTKAAATAAAPLAVANNDKSGPPTPCETDFSTRDAADILLRSTTLNRYSMSAALGERENGCEMGDENALIDFSLRTRPQLAQGSNKQLYDMMTNSGKSGTPYSGVGDKAVWFDLRDSNIPGRTEFETISLKGEMMCSVELHFKKGPEGEKAITPARGVELAKKLGALCNKSFAARGA